jgi:hypothetical protein
MTGAATIWIRRCSRCRTVDERAAWADPEAAQTDTALAEPARWYQRHRSWQCQACGGHDYIVEPHDSPRRF